jgi:hypothetical protein
MKTKTRTTKTTTTATASPHLAFLDGRPGAHPNAAGLSREEHLMRARQILHVIGLAATSDNGSELTKAEGLAIDGLTLMAIEHIEAVQR